MNISKKISDNAKLFPQKKALIFTQRGQQNSITFSELEELSNRYGNGLIDLGFKRGEKVVLFIKPSLKFHALVFALFKIGVVPILIDPGMGRKNLLRAIKEVKPEGLIAELEVHLLSFIFSSAFKSIKRKISTKRFVFGNLTTLKNLEKSINTYICVDLAPDETAAILFTSGGTGRPKGVVYTHEIFSEQTRILKDIFNLSENETDLPGFPLFSLFTLSIGMTSCIPNMDPSKPAKVDPEKLVKNILDYSATFVAGSPAIWERVADFCIQEKIKIPSVKYVVMFGAPVRNELHKKFEKILPIGTTYTPYGSTESLPITNISGKEILRDTAKLTNTGKGTCIGRPVPGIEIKVIDISDQVIESIVDVKILEENEIGEIIVKGKVVTKMYLNSPIETRKSKIYDGETFWHRVGDLGYFDHQGRLWFCGRKTHRVLSQEGLMCSIPCEAIFNQHPDVKRSALVGIGIANSQKPAIYIERNMQGHKRNKNDLTKELLAIGEGNILTKNIKSFFFLDSFPVDVRHNIKIDRTKLASKLPQGFL